MACMNGSFCHAVSALDVLYLLALRAGMVGVCGRCSVNDYTAYQANKYDHRPRIRTAMGDISGRARGCFELRLLAQMLPHRFPVRFEGSREWHGGSSRSMQATPRRIYR